MNIFFSILNFPDLLMNFLNKHIICASGNDGVSVVSIVEISQNGMWWNVKPDWDEDNQKENSEPACDCECENEEQFQLTQGWFHSIINICR